MGVYMKIPPIRNRIAMYAWNKTGAGIHKDSIDEERFICRKKVDIEEEEVDTSFLILYKIEDKEYPLYYIGPAVIDDSLMVDIEFELMEKIDLYIHIDHYKIFMFKNNSYRQIVDGKLTNIRWEG